MRKTLLSSIAVSAILLSGCASTSQPTSKVGIVNGKYAVQTTVPNNNKGKKVNLIPGQSYHCIVIDKALTKGFDLKFNRDKSFLFTAPGVSERFVYNKKFMGWKNGDYGIKFSPDNKGKIMLGNTRQKKAASFQCTQTTNNAYTSTRYLTKDEISAYQHNQQIAVQQRAINNANYNATMDRIQAQNAQRNYNTQQMLNRTNTSNKSTNSIINPSNNKFYIHSDGTSTRKVGNTYYHSNGTTTTAY